MRVDARNAASTGLAIDRFGRLSCRQEVDGRNRAALRLPVEGQFELPFCAHFRHAEAKRRLPKPGIYRLGQTRGIVTGRLSRVWAASRIGALTAPKPR